MVQLLMWTLITTALAFDPGTVMPAPTQPFAAASEQLVLARTTLSFTRLDVGAPIVGFLDRFTVGITGRVAVAHLSTPGQQAFTDIRTLGGGVWFGWQTSERVHQAFGVTGGAPVSGLASSYGLLMQEAGLAIGPAYRLHVALDRVDLDVSANANLNTITFAGGDLGLTGTWKLWDDRVGLQLGALGGLSEFVWLAPGVRVRPTPALEIGATALVGVPILDPSTDPVHVSPLMLVRVHLPERAAFEVRPSMVPVGDGG